MICHLISTTFRGCAKYGDISLQDSAVIVPLITKIIMLGRHMSDRIAWTDSAGKQHVCTVEMVMNKRTQKEHDEFYKPLIRMMGGDSAGGPEQGVKLADGLPDNSDGPGAHNWHIARRLCQLAFVKYFKGQSGRVGGIPMFRDVKIEIKANEANVKRQIDAVNKLCTDKFSVWHPLLLNHLSCHDNYDVLEKLELSDDVIAAAFSRILNNGHIVISPEQESAIRACLKPRGSCLPIHGYPGCGKTTMISMIALLFASLGAHVILSSPTNATSDALCESFTNMQNLLGYEPVLAIRAYSIFSETEAFLKEHSFSPKLEALTRKTGRKNLSNDIRHWRNCYQDSGATFIYMNTCKDRNVPPQ